jgi:hypothetical protein
VEEELNTAMKMLSGQGHTVRPHIRYGTLELGEGVYSLNELRELFVRRRAEEQSRP